jgi:serine/threonine protein phosphatase 1
MRIYAIGDIHGLLDRLRSLLARCEHDAAGAPMRLVFVGDYIDRGPDSRGAIEHVMALQERLADSVVALMGNHEAMPLAAIDETMPAGAWLTQGGAATLLSYGVVSARALPHAHVTWLRSLRMSYDDGRRLEKPLDAQDDALLWIREPFLSDARDYGRLIVHGPTPTRTGEPDLRTNRVNIDTGAVYGRALTTAVFDEDETPPRGFLQVSD